MKAFPQILKVSYKTCGYQQVTLDAGIMVLCRFCTTRIACLIKRSSTGTRRARRHKVVNTSSSPQKAW
jgi:hypothetical protein